MLDLLGYLLQIGTLVCFIWVLVYMFKNGDTVLAVISIVLVCCVGIGFIIPLVRGWQKGDSWRIPRPLLLVYTVCLIGSLIIGVITGPAMIEEFQKQWKQQMEQQQQR